MAAKYHVILLVSIALVNLFFAIIILPQLESFESFFVWGGIIMCTTYTSSYLELLISLVCWWVSRRSHLFVRENCKKLVNFQLSSVIYSTVVIGLFLYSSYQISKSVNYLDLWFLWALFIFVSPFILIFKVSTLIAGMILAFRGQILKHTFSIPFFR